MFNGIRISAADFIGNLALSAPLGSIQGLFYKLTSSLRGFISDESIKGTKRKVQPGRAYLYDGVNDYVTYSSVAGFERTSAFSFTARFFTGSATNQTIISKMENSGNFRGYQIFLQTTGEIAVTLRNTITTNYIQVNTTTQYNNSAWYNLVVTYDGSSTAAGVKVYINGSSVSLTTVANTLSATIVNATALNSGARAGAANFFNGKMFDVRCYSKELTQNEVTYINSYGVSGTDPTVSNLVFWNKGDEGYDITAEDCSGNGNFGTKTNITSATFHYEGLDVPYSWQNEVGYGGDNYLLRSNDISNAAWTKGNGTFTFTGGQSDPFGGTAAVQLAPSASDTFAGQTSTAVYTAAIGEVWTVSFYGKSVSGTKTVRFGLASGVSAYHNGFCDFTLTTTWQRFTRTVPVISAVTIGAIIQSQSNTNAFIVYGIQVEKNNVATPYRETTTTRRAGYLPRNESNIGFDNYGFPLSYVGKAPADAIAEQSACGTLDGIDDYVSIPSSATLALTSNFSVSLWARTSTTAGVNSRRLYTRDSAGFLKPTVWQIANTNVIGFGHANGYIAGPAAITDGLWYHYVFTCGAGTSFASLKGYRNGEPLTVTNIGSFTGFETGNALTYIGGAAVANSYFNGNIAGVEVFNSELTPAQVVELYNTGLVTSVNPVGAWPFPEYSGSTAYDTSGNGNHGTITNATTTTGAGFWANKQDNYHWSFAKGFRASSGAEIPARIDGSAAADGNPITNPAGAWHNGGITSIDFTNNTLSPWAGTYGWEGDYDFGEARTPPNYKTVVSSVKEHKFYTLPS